MSRILGALGELLAAAAAAAGGTALIIAILPSIIATVSTGVLPRAVAAGSSIDAIRVDALSGTAHARRADPQQPQAQRRSLRPGAVVRRGDVIETGPSGRLLLSIDDGSQIVIGPATSVRMVQVLSEPRPGSSLAAFQAARLGAFPTSSHTAGGVLMRLDRGSMRFKAARGTFSWLTRDKRVEVRTAVATVSCAGADIILQRHGAQLSVVVVSGRAHVRNSGGLVEIDQAQYGIDGIRVAQAPPSATRWKRSRMSRMRRELSIP